VRLARPSGRGASVDQQADTADVAVEFAVSSARNAASSPVSCCIIVQF